MLSCGDKYLNLGRLCISFDDFVMIIFNLVSITTIITSIYVKSLLDKSLNLKVQLKNNFTILSEGLLSTFYSTSSLPQKAAAGPKKKLGSKISLQPNQPEKQSNKDELKCNQCGRLVEVSYQYTFHKLVSPN